jgi:hypothetical protein
MTTVVAIDPGKDHVGFSVFYKSELVYSTFIKSENQYELHKAVCNEWACQAVKLNVSVADVLVIENQQVYNRSKGDPNDLIPLSFVAGSIYATIPHKKFLHPLPKTWKGSVPKKMFTNRILQYVSMNFHEEFLTLDSYTAKELIDVVDAIGLGLWAIGVDLVRGESYG